MSTPSRRFFAHPLNRWAFFFLLVFTLFAVTVSTSPTFAQNGDDSGGMSDEVKKAANMNFFAVALKAIDSTTIEFKIAFAILSVVTVALVVILLLELRMGAAIPAGFVDEFSDMVNDRQFKQAFELCKTDQSFLARVLSTGMGRLQYGVEDARHAAFNTVESIRSNKGQVVNYLAVVGTISPMVGLFGTVRGMIGAFAVMETSTRPNPQALAGQISNALGTTFLGIAVAVIALVFTTFFQNRLTRMAMDTANLGDDLLTQMYRNSQNPGAPAPTPGTPVQGAPAPGQPPARLAVPQPNPNVSNVRPSN